MRTLLPILWLMAPACSGARPQAAGWAPAPIQGTREELRAALVHLEAAARSPSSSQALRDEAWQEAELVRQRLAEGDFQPGDRIWLVLEGEPELSDTFAVRTGRVLTLPVAGDIPLTGVLRSELEVHLTERLGRFFRDPVVQARPLIRISISGEVARPGFYLVPTDVPLTDVLMAAGGPTRTAKSKEIRVERDGRPLWKGQALQQGIAEGRTIDQLNLRPGDRIHVPAGSQFNTLQAVRIGVFGVPALIVALTRIF